MQPIQVRADRCQGLAHPAGVARGEGVDQVPLGLGQLSLARRVGLGHGRDRGDLPSDSLDSQVVVAGILELRLEEVEALEVLPRRVDEAPGVDEGPASAHNRPHRVLVHEGERGLLQTRDRLLGVRVVEVELVQIVEPLGHLEVVRRIAAVLGVVHVGQELLRLGVVLGPHLVYLVYELLRLVGSLGVEGPEAAQGSRGLVVILGLDLRVGLEKLHLGYAVLDRGGALRVLDEEILQEVLCLAVLLLRHEGVGGREDVHALPKGPAGPPRREEDEKEREDGLASHLSDADTFPATRYLAPGESVNFRPRIPLIVGRTSWPEGFRREQKDRYDRTNIEIPSGAGYTFDRR